MIGEKPTFKFSKVTKSGVIHLDFKNKMKVLQINSRKERRERQRRHLREEVEEKLTIYQQLDKDIVEVNLMKNENGQFYESDSFDWEILDYEEYVMKIKLFFDEPTAVSASGLDRIRVSFKDTTLIYDTFGQEID